MSSTFSTLRNKHQEAECQVSKILYDDCLICRFIAIKCPKQPIVCLHNAQLLFHSLLLKFAKKLYY